MGKFSTSLLGLACTFLFSHVSAYTVSCKGLDEEVCKDKSSNCMWYVSKSGNGKCGDGICNKMTEKTCGKHGYGCEWVLGLKCGKAKVKFVFFQVFLNFNDSVY